MHNSDTTTAATNADVWVHRRGSCSTSSIDGGVRVVTIDLLGQTRDREVLMGAKISPMTTSAAPMVLFSLLVGVWSPVRSI